MTRALLCSVSIATLLAAAPAFAAEAPNAPTPDVAGLEGSTAVAELIVTATRSPQAADRIGASVTVLSTADIEAAQSPDVIELLNDVPGVSYTRNGGVGAVSGVNIRGAESSHTVLLIDGVKMNDPTAPQGAANFGNLLVGDVARIEVLRGAQSTLWGSQAIGGVVNIVTREPADGFQATLDAEGGSRGTAYVRAGLGGATEQLSWRIAGSRYQTKGVSAFAAGSEDDGYENTGLSGRLRLTLTDAVSAEVRAVWSDGEADTDGFAGDDASYGATEELVVYTGVNVALLDGRLKNRLAFGYTETDRRAHQPSDPVAPITFEGVGEIRRWEYQGVLAVTEDWTAAFGLETEQAEMRQRAPWTFDPNPPFTTGKVGVDSLYGQVQGVILPGLTITAGLRHDDHDTYGGHTLGSLAGAWSLNDGATVLRASFGQGFRAPGLYELYSEYGNTALSPEEFNSWDLGVEQRLAEGVIVSATYFRREADNEIRFYSCVFGSPEPLCNPKGVFRFGYYDNIQKTQAQGLELAGRAVAGPLTLSGAYTWTEAQNASGINDGNQLPRRPEHMANVSATWRWSDAITTTAAVRYAGEAFNNDANTVVMDDYTLVDLRASWRLSDTVELYGRVENLFDEDYETARGYGTPGRGAFIGVRARF
jgi:vitamin B12 transporter